MKACVEMSYDIEDFGEVIEGDSFDKIKFFRMPAGFVMIIRCSSNLDAVKHEEYINERVHELMDLDDFKKVDLETLNYCLYK
jgi:hypothetical protein